MTAEINRFAGRFSFLSNFYPAEVTLDGIQYPTVEHAYQAAKTLNKDRRVGIQAASSPGAAKKKGKSLPLRDDWETIKLSIMKGLLIDKFKIDELRNFLLRTEGAILIEGNYWFDTYWGVCDGIGQNHLGRLLMEVRDEIKRENVHD